MPKLLSSQAIIFIHHKNNLTSKCVSMSRYKMMIVSKIMRTPEKKQKKTFDELPVHLKKAYRKREEAGKSPKAVGEEKAAIALDWIYRWGWASPGTIDTLGNSARRGLAARLVQRGFLKKTRTESGGAVAGVPSFLLTLTELGISEVERNRTENCMPYEQSPWKNVNQMFLRHDQLVQESTARAMINKTITGYKTPKEIKLKSEPGIKQPDAIWMCGNVTQAVEVELTRKYDRQLDQFVSGCLYLLKSEQFDYISFVTDSKAILKAYQSALSKNSKYSKWKKNDRGIWKIEGEPQVIEEELASKFTWTEIKKETKKEKEKREKEEKIKSENEKPVFTVRESPDFDD